MRPIACTLGVLAGFLLLSSRSTAGGGGNTWAIPFQASLKTASGMPLNGNVQITFRLYSSSIDTTALWTEVRTVVASQGLIALSLGQVTPVPQPFPVPAYVGIQVGSDPEMTPRVLLTAAPYAFRLPNVYVDALGNVGVGASTPQHLVDIESPLQAVIRLRSKSSLFGSVIELRNDTDIGAGSGFYGAVNFANKDGAVRGQVSYEQDMAHEAVAFRVAGSERARIDSTGRIGIGTTLPQASIDITDPGTTSAIRLNSTAPAGSVIDLRSDATTIGRIGSLDFTWKGTLHGGLAYRMVGNSNDGLAFTVGQAERARLTTSGNLGIGTNDPQYPLDILSGGQAVLRMQSQSAGYGSTIELRNNSATQTLVGALNFVPKDGSYAGQVGYSTGSGMSFRTNGADRVWITPSGDVGLGTSSPNAALHIDGHGRDGIRIYNNGPGWAIRIQDPSSGNRVPGIDINGSSRLFCTNMTDSLIGWAVLQDDGTWQSTSDARLKTDITAASGLLEKALALRPVTYYLKNQDHERDPDRKLGFVAQDVERILPNLVGQEQYKTVNYSAMSVVAIGAIQELAARKDAEIAALRDRNTALEDRLKRLEEAVAKLLTEKESGHKAR